MFVQGQLIWRVRMIVVRNENPCVRFYRSFLIDHNMDKHLPAVVISVRCKWQKMK